MTRGITQANFICRMGLPWEGILKIHSVLPLLSFKDGSTALFKAAFKGHNGVIEELLKFSPSLGLLKVKRIDFGFLLFLLLFL